MRDVKPGGLGKAAMVWSAMPRTAGEQFRPFARELGRTIMREILREVPVYARLLDGTYQRTVVGYIEQAILWAIDDVGDRVPRSRGTQLFRRLGELEFEYGRSIDHLLTAYRVAGRVAWQYIATRGQACGFSTGLLCRTAEALFTYVDEVSAISVEGHTAARARSLDTVAGRRRKLLAAIVADPPASPDELAELAAAARWAPPERVVAVALEPGAERRHRAFPQLSEATLVDLEHAEPRLAGDSAEDLASLTEGVTGWRVAMGPRVRLGDAALSLRCARRALELMRRNVLAGPFVRCEEHLVTLCVSSDQFLLRELCTRSLAPLAGLKGNQRARLSETLLGWLRVRGSAAELAAELDVHPQTIRYRMRQLHELFGDRLTDPERRLELELALKAQGLLPVQESRE
ncbi:helix-turn-helix domain-containing protein [Amycolatopsis aidingensis]|uniref:PucR family transcriptional regulator n=1 Tax=Amycolatopsis aidingensis TaxID=2842453 RepID=UPI001E4E1A48|nr:PucR family transcriptional regulator [Amycolatopsis aidingensis]